MIFNILIAVVIDLLIGDPKFLPHPVKAMGSMITFMEKLLCRIKQKKFAGFVLTFVVVVTWGIIGYAVRYLPDGIRIIAEIYLLYTTLAGRSLSDESLRVLSQSTLDDKRAALSMIVGRDTATLDEDAVLRATTETIAENTIDGVVAPLFYIFLGLPFGMSVPFALMLKASSTLDSMVGYKNEKYIHLGFASAKLDDILMFIPARLGSIFMLVSGALVGGNIFHGFKIFFRDRLKSSSPNAGHGESVVAGLFGIRLCGPSSYGGKIIDKPYIGDDINPITERFVRKTASISIITELLITITYPLLVIRQFLGV